MKDKELGGEGVWDLKSVGEIKYAKLENTLDTMSPRF
jgi:hypothetical protein